MKEFSLEDAIVNKKEVCTRNGRTARILCYDKLNSCPPYYPIVALVKTPDGKDESIQQYSINGHIRIDEDVDEFDLMIVEDDDNNTTESKHKLGDWVEFSDSMNEKQSGIITEVSNDGFRYTIKIGDGSKFVLVHEKNILTN